MDDRVGFLDRLILAVAPGWAARRNRNRAVALTLSRHYEAAQGGRRTSAWHRAGTDANAAAKTARAPLRHLARDLVANNGWARNATRAITRNTVGWGIMAKPLGGSDETRERARDVWRAWADTRQVDSDGLMTFQGLQRLVLSSVAISGEVLVRRRRRRTEDGLTLPLQLQVIEPDFIDSARDGMTGPGGGPIVQGIEFDRIGRRVAYWLYEEHPGSASQRRGIASRRIPAEDVIHVFDVERPGQVRGMSWFGAAIAKLQDFDDYEDATLMRQKIAACFAAFVTDVDGSGSALGEEDGEILETLEPGQINYLAPGQDVEFSNPPMLQDASFSASTLRRIAAALGVTYEDLTGDYSKVNFSSSRMARIAHWGNVHDWRWNMLIPQLCDRVWEWAMEAALLEDMISEKPGVEWTPPPMPMLEPDREGLAYIRQVRAGAMTHDQMVRELGGDPDTHWQDYADGLKRLDELKIWLDSDVRRVSAAGLTQERTGGATESGARAAGEDDSE